MQNYRRKFTTNLLHETKKELDILRKKEKLTRNKYIEKIVKEKYDEYLKGVNKYEKDNR